MAAATGHVHLVIATNEAAGEAVLSADGMFDRRRGRYSLSVDLPRHARRGSQQVVAVDDRLYVRDPVLARSLGVATPWISVRLADSAALGRDLLDPLRLLDAGGQDHAEVDLDDHGLVRRITMRFDAAGNKGSVVVSADYSDFGAPVVIEPPPADQVTDRTDAVDRLFGAQTGG
jgi:hypothetical protein